MSSTSNTPRNVRSFAGSVLIVGALTVGLGSDVGAAPRAISKSNPQARAAALATPSPDSTLTGQVRSSIESRCLAAVAAAVPISSGAPQIVAWRRGEFPGRVIALVATSAITTTSLPTSSSKAAGSGPSVPTVSGYRITLSDTGARCRVIAVAPTTVAR